MSPRSEWDELGDTAKITLRGLGGNQPGPEAESIRKWVHSVERRLRASEAPPPLSKRRQELITTIVAATMAAVAGGAGGMIGSTELVKNDLSHLERRVESYEEHRDSMVQRIRTAERQVAVLESVTQARSQALHESLEEIKKDIEELKGDLRILRRVRR